MNSTEKQILEKLKTARDHYLDQEYSAAIDLYLELADELKDDKDNISVIRIELGWSHYYNEDYLKAIEVFDQAMEDARLAPQQQFDCLRLIGFSYEMLGDLKKARKYIEQALDVNIADSEKRYSYFELGKVLFNLGDIIEAEHAFKIAESLFKEYEPDYQHALEYYLGFTAYFQKKFKIARQYFDKILEGAEDTKIRATGFFGLAHLHYHHRDYQALIDICEKILRLDETFFDKETLGYFLSSAYLNLQRWEGLEMFFNELEANYPNGRYAAEYPKFRKALDAHLSPDKK